MAVRTGRLDMRDANAQAKVEALAKTLGEGPHLSARRYPRLPGHRSSVTSAQPNAGGPMAEMLSLLPSCGSNSMITLSVMGLMNCPSREPLTISWPEIVVPELVIVPARASSPRLVLMRVPDLKYAASHAPPALRHAPVISPATLSDSSGTPPALIGEVTPTGTPTAGLLRMRTPLSSRICNDAWNTAGGGTFSGVSACVM